MRRLRQSTFDGHRRRFELAVEVGEPDDVDRRVGIGIVEQVETHLALAVLGHGDVEEEGRCRRKVDAADVDGDAPRDGVATGQERGPHVGVALEVLDIGHVPVLAEERRAGDQGARCHGVELVQREVEHDEVPGPGRVGHVRGPHWARSGCCSAPRPS